MFVCCTKGFGGVFDDGEVVFAGDFKNWVEVNGVTEDVDGHDRFNALPRGFVERFAFGVGAFVAYIIGDGGRIHLPVAGFGVDEDRRCAEVADTVGTGDESEVADEDLVAGLDAAGLQGDLEGSGSVGASDCTRCADDFGEILFKFRDVTPDAADPAGIEAFFDVIPFATGDVGNAKRDGGGGFRRHRFLAGI